MSIANQYKGKSVVIRADRSGCFYGVLIDIEGSKVILSRCRRMWRWSANNLSELAIHGVTNEYESKFSSPLDNHLINDMIEILPLNDKSLASLDGVQNWERYNG